MFMAKFPTCQIALYIASALKMPLPTVALPKFASMGENGTFVPLSAWPLKDSNKVLHLWRFSKGEKKHSLFRVLYKSRELDGEVLLPVGFGKGTTPASVYCRSRV